MLSTFFVKDNPLVASVPRLTPLPGSILGGVVATGEWDEAFQLAKITWTASTDPNLQHYKSRFVSGPDYSTDDEAVSGNIPPEGPLGALHRTVGRRRPGRPWLHRQLQGLCPPLHRQ